MRPIPLAVILTLFTMSLTGCGGGGSATSAAPVAQAGDQTGQLAVTLTDAEGDFTAYDIDVTAVTLHRANGTVVETLPLSTRVDFAQLTEVTEFLTVATVPAGTYESVSLGLDFSSAEILVQDVDGNELAAQAVDENGAAIGPLTVRLHLADTDHIRIAPGVPAAFSLDFDLDSSNDINLMVSPPVVTVMPFLLATAELETDRSHRVRGVLDAVDETASTITLKVRPFRHRGGNFGEFTLVADDDTLYEIDGVGYSGAAGLTAMAQLAVNLPVVAGGAIEAGELVAATVLAGSSVPWTDHDVVRGVVVARTDDALTVQGALIEYRDGIKARRAEMTVLVGPDTGVTALGLDNASLDKDSLSVGQRIVAFGELTDERTLDASGDHVRMEISQLTAEVLESTPLAVELYYLSGRRPTAFDFAGTGMSQADDADPAFYQIATSTLPLANVDAGDLVRVRGHVNGFSLAPDDFLAQTVIDVDLDMRGASFVAQWPVATATPFSSIDSRRIDLVLDDARSLLKVRGVPIGVTNPLEALSLTAPDGGRGAYAVRVRGSGEIHLYRNFADLVTELTDQLDNGRQLKRVGAHGRYNKSSEELISGRAGFDFIVPAT